MQLTPLLLMVVFVVFSTKEISSTNFDPVIQKGEMEIECVHIEKS